MTANMWECDCGHIVYGKYPPEECTKCWKINSFVEVPEDLAEQIKDNVLAEFEGESENEEDEDIEEALR